MCTSNEKEHSSTYELFQNFNLCTYRNFRDLGLLKSVSVHDCKTVSLFFQVIFATNFDVIF